MGFNLMYHRFSSYCVCVCVCFGREFYDAKMLEFTQISLFKNCLYLEHKIPSPEVSNGARQTRSPPNKPNKKQIRSLLIKPVLRIRIHRIHMFLGLPDPDPLVRGMDPDPAPDPAPDPGPSIIMQK
jgi:hypothetical protein